VFESLKCREGEIISSSRVRALLARGAVAEARDLLGWSD
jgi:FAD synthase